jgi:hypothetical protein
VSVILLSVLITLLTMIRRLLEDLALFIKTRKEEKFLKAFLHAREHSSALREFRRKVDDLVIALGLYRYFDHASVERSFASAISKDLDRYNRKLATISVDINGLFHLLSQCVSYV